MPHFARRLKVVVFEHRGFGRSRCGKEHFKSDYFHGDIRAILDAEGIDKGALVCQSMGGWGGLKLAVTHPERVAALVLANTPGGLDTPKANAAIEHLASYLHYLENGLREAFDPPGTPIRLHFRKGENPYAGGQEEAGEEEMTKNDKSRFSIVMRSDIDYEYLFASIEYDGEEVAIVQQEDGKNHLKLEASFGNPVKTGTAWVVDLDGFLDAVQMARVRLLER
jgi:pimeloyl-ACP methyl ester carboxylesterase